MSKITYLSAAKDQVKEKSIHRIIDCIVAPEHQDVFKKKYFKVLLNIVMESAPEFPLTLPNDISEEDKGIIAKSVAKYIHDNFGRIKEEYLIEIIKLQIQVYALENMLLPDDVFR